MRFRDRPQAVSTSTSGPEELAAQAFLRRRLGSWNDADELELKKQLESDPIYANAFARVEESWTAVGKHATSAELMVLREQALSRARRSNSRRWRLPARPLWHRPGVKVAALAAGMLLFMASAYQWAPFGLRPGEYRTAVGEQRMIELEDHSRVALDAATRLKVRFSDDARIIQLLEGQAQFSVAQDPQRPFKVQVGERTIVALGTKFTVEYIDKKFNLAMLEGKVAVITEPSSVPPSGDTSSGQPGTSRSSVTVEQAATQSAAKNPLENKARATASAIGNAPNGIIELSAGEALQIDRDGQSKLIAKADIKTASAWREGKVIFNAETLHEAIRRLNRYSRLRVEVTDPELASMRVTGVFDTGDTQAFIEAVQGSLPVTVDYSDSSTIRLRSH